MATLYPSVRTRFETFMSGQSQVEDVDWLLKGKADPHGLHRADYLFGRRQVIFEVKSLEDDPGEKLATLVQRVTDERGIIFFGQMTTDRLFAGQPDTEELKRKFYNVVTKNVQAITRTADKQTRDTKAIFGLPNAAGVLVILNDTSFTLDPELIMHRVAITLQEEKDGELRYPHNQSAVLLQESHFLADADGPQKLIPQLTVHGPTASRYCGLNRVLADLVQAWAHFNRMPYAAQTVSAMTSAYVPTRAASLKKR